MSSISHAPLVISAHQLDLFELLRIVKSQKNIVFSVAFIFVLMAVAYVFFVTPIYQVSSVLRPAAINELDALNRSGIYKLPPGESLQRVGASLDSYETRLGFFKSNASLFKEFERPGKTLEQSFEDFNRDSIKLALPDPKKADALDASVTLEMNYPKGIDGPAIINGLVNYAISSERDRISADLGVIVQNRLNELKEKIAAARSGYEMDKEAKIASLLEADNLKRDQLQDELKALRLQLKAERNDRITQLTEAIDIAKSLGIQKPTTPSALAESSGASSNNIMRTEVNNQQIPLYFMGVDALEAERKVLNQRKSDDFTEKRIAEIGKELELLKTNRQVQILQQRNNEDIFLIDVQQFRAEITRLRNLNINMGKVKLVSIDRLALEPSAPIKPKKAMIVSLAFIFGLVFGVLLVVLRQLIFLLKHRSHVAEIAPVVSVLPEESDSLNMLR
ncbi:Wzz/FepE/Etk N-terminal domain-containing protein [Pseudomonas asplenii]|uniref:Wzz/FepE/Etk N-terminal domain-containing protein n=1 Tax=Pseudomonas asplenii TaxID=53407 RepID=UPI00041D7BFA|nr:Wzz/FepE/Etk N-terminal domain-containing protein [Pseudomonas fuscovaginae]